MCVWLERGVPSHDVTVTSQMQQLRGRSHTQEDSLGVAHNSQGALLHEASNQSVAGSVAEQPMETLSSV